MNVLMVEPGKAPYETQIGDDLQSMQALVGGYIQAVYPFEQPVALVCRESGKLDGLPLNRALRDSDGDIYDIIAGNFFIVGLGQNDFTDLPHELAEQFAERFRQPEIFMHVDGKSLPRRCRTSRCRAGWHIDRRIHETGNDTDNI